MKQVLLDLLKIHSTADCPRELACVIAYVKSFFIKNKHSFVIKTYKYKEKESIIILPHQTKSPKIFLSGHLDVVSAPADQFKPKIKGSRIYARGSRDMKGPVVAMMFALQEIFTSGEKVDVGLMLTTDEEVGGFCGTDFLLNKEGYSCQCAFLPDSSLSWHLCTDEKAVWHIKFSFTGQSAHNSRPWLGESAVEQAMQAYHYLQTTFHNKWGIPNAKNHWFPTVSLGLINGGSATNQVPYEASFTVDIRFPNEIKESSIQEVIDLVITKFKGVAYAEAKGNAMYTSKNNYFSKTWLTMAKQIMHKKVRSLQSAGSSDARYFSALNIPVVMSNPLSSEPHIAQEWIDYEDLILYKDLLKEWLLKVG